MTDLRAALADALGPLYRVEREVRPVGDCRLFVAREVPTGPELLVKLLPARLSLAVDSGVFEREVLLVADRLRHPQLVAPRGAVRAPLRRARAPGRRRPRAARRHVRRGSARARDADGTAAGAGSGAARGSPLRAPGRRGAGAPLSRSGAGRAVGRRGGRAGERQPAGWRSCVDPREIHRTERRRTSRARTRRPSLFPGVSPMSKQIALAALAAVALAACSATSGTPI